MCMNLLEEKKLLSSKEWEIIGQGKNIWFGEYDGRKMASLQLIFGQYQLENKSNERKNALYAAMSALAPFEKYTENDAFQRPNTLRYFVHYLKHSGVAKEEIYNILKNHFQTSLLI